MYTRIYKGVAHSSVYISVFCSLRSAEAIFRDMVLSVLVTASGGSQVLLAPPGLQPDVAAVHLARPVRGENAQCAPRNGGGASTGSAFRGLR